MVLVEPAALVVPEPRHLLPAQVLPTVAAAVVVERQQVVLVAPVAVVQVGQGRQAALTQLLTPVAVAAAWENILQVLLEVTAVAASSLSVLHAPCRLPLALP